MYNHTFWGHLWKSWNSVKLNIYEWVLATCGHHVGLRLSYKGYSDKFSTHKELAISQKNKKNINTDNGCVGFIVEAASRIGLKKWVGFHRTEVRGKTLQTKWPIRHKSQRFRVFEGRSSLNRAVVFRMWFLDHQLQHHLGAIRNANSQVSIDSHPMTQQFHPSVDSPWSLKMQNCVHEYSSTIHNRQKVGTTQSP